MKQYFSFFIFFLVFISVISFTSATVIIEQPSSLITNVNVFQGNITNLSQLEDTNVPSPSNNEVLTWNSATNKWIAQVVGAATRWLLSPATGGYIYNETGDTLKFNETLLNNTIDDRASGLGDNSTFNESLTNSLYSNLTFQGNLTSFGCAGTDKMSGVLLNGTINCTSDVSGAGTGKAGNPNYLFNNSDTMFFNDTLLNITIDDRASGTGDNASWNASLIPTFNVNSTNFWDDIDAINLTHFSNVATNLTISTSWLTNFINNLLDPASNNLQTNISDVNSSLDAKINAVTDTNETAFIGNLTENDCPGGQVVIGVQTNGTVLCVTDATSTSTRWPTDNETIINVSDALSVNRTWLNDTIGVYSNNLANNISDVNSSLDAKIEAINGGDNASWNASLIPDFHVNNSNNWNTSLGFLSNVNETQFQINENFLTIGITWLESVVTSVFNSQTTDDLAEGAQNFYGNRTWNQTLGDLLYDPIGSSNASWNESEASRLYVNITGDTMTGNLSMNNINDITDILRTHYNVTGCGDDQTPGTMCYDEDHDTFKIFTLSGQVIQIGQEVSNPMKNAESFTVMDGDYVYASGTSGDNIEFKQARADNFSTSSMVGVVTTECAPNAICPVTFFGFVNGIDTSDFSEFDKRYLSHNESGNSTTTPPPFPNNIIQMDTVVRVNAVTGRVFVFPRLDTSNGMTFNTIGVIGDIIQTDYKIRSLPGNAAVGQNVFCIEMNGSTGNTSCHLTLQPGGPGQASAWERSGIVVPEDSNCNNENRTDPNCFANSAGYTWVLNDFNTSVSEGADWGITGELEVIKDAYIHGNLTVNDSIIQDDYFIKPKDSNDQINGKIFTINANSTTPEDIPFVGFIPGGPGQASWMGSSSMLVDRNATILNTINASSCTAWFNSEGIEQKVDCNSTSPTNPLGTGPDKIIFGDIQVVGESWLRNTRGEWKFFSRTLSLFDEQHSNIVYERLVQTLSGNILEVNNTGGDNIVVNINANETIKSSTNDSIALNLGTNTTPTINHITYQNEANPVLTIDGVEPSVNHAEVAIIYVGDSQNQLYLFDNTVSHNTEFMDSVYDTFGDLGAIYRSGFEIDSSSSEINFSNGQARIRLNQIIYNNNVSNIDDFYIINSSGQFLNATSNSIFTEYSDGTAIGNNNFFNVVWGVVPTATNTMRMMAVVQAFPGAGNEYSNIQNAEADVFRKTNFFPSVTDIKVTFIPVARTIIRQDASDNFQTLSDGDFFIDLRGEAISGGGSPSNPSITDHNNLNNLNSSVWGHIFDTVLDLGSNNLTTTGFVNGLFNFSITSIYASFDGATIVIDDALLNTNLNDTDLINNVNLTLSNRIDAINEDNASWNASLIPDFNVNSSNFWDNLDAINLTHFSNVGTNLTISTSWLTDFINLLLDPASNNLQTNITNVNSTLDNKIIELNASTIAYTDTASANLQTNISATNTTGNMRGLLDDTYLNKTGDNAISLNVTFLSFGPLVNMSGNGSCLITESLSVTDHQC